MADIWITFDDALNIVRTTRGGSIGWAEALVRAALKSAEVRTKQPQVLLTADDGVVGMDLRPGAQIERAAARISKDDFVDWLDRNAPAAVNGEAEPVAAEGGHLAKLARDAAATIWPDGIPKHTPPQVLFKRVADRVQQQHQVKISKSTVRRALGLK